MKILLIVSVLLIGCSNVSFNKNINPEPSEFNKYSMKWERSLSGIGQ